MKVIGEKKQGALWASQAFMAYRTESTNSRSGTGTMTIDKDRLVLIKEGIIMGHTEYKTFVSLD